MFGMGVESASWIPQGAALVCILAAMPQPVGDSLIYAFGVDGDSRQLRGGAVHGQGRTDPLDHPDRPGSCQQGLAGEWPVLTDRKAGIIVSRR